MATTTDIAPAAGTSRDIHRPRTVVALLAALAGALTLVVLGVGSALSSGIDPDTDGAAPIADVVRDGSFAFTVLDVQRGVSQVGDRYYGEKADGGFTLVAVKIQNIGSERRTFDAAFARGFDADGQPVRPDRDAAYFIDSPGADLAAGEDAVVTLVFDTDESRQPQLLRLHDSALSRGVLVSLRG